MAKLLNHSVEWDAAVKRWAWIRLVLGWLQMIGAAISLLLLLRGGASGGAVAAVSITGMFMVISVVLFGVLKLPRSGRRSS